MADKLFKRLDSPLKSGLGEGALLVVVIVVTVGMDVTVTPGTGFVFKTVDGFGAIVILGTENLLRLVVVVVMGVEIFETTVLLGARRLLLMMLGTLIVVMPRLIGLRFITLTELLVSPER